jgi:hypothetical protein
VLPFSHKLEPGTVNITGFKVADTDSSGYIYSMYDEDGVLKLKKTHATVVGLTKILYSDVGRVDYDTGLVTVSNFKPNLLTDVYITVSASCSLADDQSLVGVKNSILKFNTINVTPLAVKK